MRNQRKRGKKSEPGPEDSILSPSFSTAGVGVLCFGPVAKIKSSPYGRGAKEMRGSEGCFDCAMLLSINRELPRWKWGSHNPTLSCLARSPASSRERPPRSPDIFPEVLRHWPAHSSSSRRSPLPLRSSLFFPANASQALHFRLVFTWLCGLCPGPAITSECGDINMSKCRKRDEIKHILLKEMRAPYERKTHIEKTWAYQDTNRALGTSGFHRHDVIGVFDTRVSTCRYELHPCSDH